MNDSQQIVNRTIDDSSGEQHVHCSNSDQVVSDNETNNQQQYPGGSQPNTSFRQPTSSRAQTSSHDSLSHLSRPKFKIEPYDGNPMKWNLWYGLFATLIHNHFFSIEIDASPDAYHQNSKSGYLRLFLQQPNVRRSTCKATTPFRKT